MIFSSRPLVFAQAGMGDATLTYCRQPFISESPATRGPGLGGLRREVPGHNIIVIVAGSGRDTRSLSEGSIHPAPATSADHEGVGGLGGIDSSR